jgi:hypothetical protein
MNYQQQASTLYFLLGKAVWTIQHLEDALNTAIIIKNPDVNAKAEAEKLRKSYRKLPLGRAIERADKEQTFNEDLQKNLQDFLQKRNWLIHRCMHESVDDAGYIIEPENLFKRVESIHLSALSLKETIEIDLLEFAKSKGRSDIVETVRKSYIEWVKNHSDTPVDIE